MTTITKTLGNCALAAATFAGVTTAESALANHPEIDKSAFHLSNPPPWEFLRDLLTSQRDGRHNVVVKRSFPLTLTLSLREREQRATD